MAFTEKGDKFQRLKGEIHTIIQDECMVCAGSSQEEVERIREILEKNGIAPERVEEEMQKLVDNFVFAAGWTKPGEGCYVYTDTFLAVCLKLLYLA
jgi:hypothetical protein